VKLHLKTIQGDVIVLSKSKKADFSKLINFKNDINHVRIYIESDLCESLPLEELIHY
jgi:hypothetical protein